MTVEARKEPRHPAVWVLYAGLAVFLGLAFVTAGELRDEWRQAAARSRSEAVFDLVETATPTRPTGTPGAVAWLDLQIKRYGDRRLPGGERTLYRELVSVQGAAVPSFMEPVRRAMVTPRLDAGPSGLPAAGVRRLDERGEAAVGAVNAGAGRSAPETDMQFRSQHYLAMEGDGEADRRFVLTRRSSFDGAQGGEGSRLFLGHALPYLARVAELLTAESPLPGIAGRPLRRVRIYALSEDGTFVSLPMTEMAPAERGGLLWEGRQFRRQPLSPTFVSNEFFFRFDFDRAARFPEAQAYYSGLYLDLAGHGLVTTVTLPVADPSSGFLAVLAVDVAFEIDWEDFARGLESPQTAHLAEVPGPASGAEWRPWSAMLRGLGDGPRNPTFDAMLQELAQREQSAGYTAAAGSLYHAVVPALGAVAAFQVSAERWLVVFFPELPSRFPRLLIALLTLLGLSLVTGLEASRRLAVAAQVKAEGELREKESLLNSMRVPLTVVDPNSDAVVYGNDAALALGLAPGRRIAEVVSERGREHYDRMQSLSNETRRAYGVPIDVETPRGGSESRHAVVRSAAVAAPIEALNADERHRLGVLFLLEPESDLAIYNRDLELRFREDERRRLAGILSHGVETLAKVLAHRLEAAPEAQGDPLARWLADYLQRRLRVTVWLLDHWHASPPLPAETTVEAGQARATLERLREVFEAAQRGAELRSRLHWDNGVLAEDPGPGVFDLSLEWPENVFLVTPVLGGFGLFLEEALVNAVRHGCPGDRPRVAIRHDPVRCELRFEISNRLPGGDPRDATDLEPYGGRRLLERMARLFDWRGLEMGPEGGYFHARWRAGAGERVGPQEVD